MNNLQDFQLFQDTLIISLEKIRKNIPKKYKAYKDYIKETSQQIKQLQQSQQANLSVNKYFLIYKLAINSKIQKLIDVSINAIAILVQNNFLDGNCEDYTQDINLEDFKEQLEQKKSDPSNKRKLIQTIIETIIQTVNPKDEQIQQNIIKIIVELATNKKSELHGSSLSQSIETLIYIYSNGLQEQDKKEQPSSYNNENKTQEEQQGNAFTECLEELNHYLKYQNDYQNNQFTYQSLCYNVVQGMIDQVCVQNEELLNENSQKIGQYRWCYYCRNPANNFCKELNIPVCSDECQTNIIQKEEKINKEYNVHISFCKSTFEDCLTILYTLSNILSSEQEQMVNFVGSLIKQKILVLKILYSILYLKDINLFEKQQAVQIIKESLFNGILKCALHSDSNILQQTFSIFLILFINHKKELKNEILIFINEIIIKLLESTNSSSSHKYLALQVFNNYFQKSQIVIDFYVNYDCSPNQIQLTEKAVQILSFISTGYYKKPEFSLLINSLQEQNLSSYAIETLCILIKSIFDYYENYQMNLQKNEPNKNNLDESSNNIYNIHQNDEPQKSIDTVQLQNQIDRQDYIKIETQRAIMKFNKKPNSGIKHLFETGILKADDAKGITQFLRNNNSISKDALGEYIGGYKEININVLSEFTDALNFKGMKLDEAMRYFLTEFTLPGEVFFFIFLKQKQYKIRHKQQIEFFKNSEINFKWIILRYLIVLEVHIHYRFY
ncbi:sec7 domain protein [Ichthyophthirius multifiliis]|uniref:Sec7 domain protein n=1 Tax=Ichthyophthirius multifiliis TaxID=5932 RepID=G0QQ77_ICHMU|nr:sec7 domain protein [Ichthyophthirius multifiliis]EGR32637.1 sec7 domain protein [Ichthyophthirius multifiliis]|eukprot:XP_004036623.1 sec7 domain protein [Ichthyophthirius multifiliis]